MLFSFSIQNWRTFRSASTLSMKAARERLNSHRLIRLHKYQWRLLRAAVLFGKNASGKSNFIQAMAGGRDLVLGRINTAILAEGQHRGTAMAKSRLRMAFHILPDAPNKIHLTNPIYQYSFSIEDGVVCEEQLLLQRPSADRILFRRRRRRRLETSRRLELEGYSQEHLRDIARKTPPDTLMLTFAHSRSPDLFGNLYSWFERLCVIDLENTDHSLGSDVFGTEFTGDNGEKMLAVLSEILCDLDIGISELYWEEVPFEIFACEAGLSDAMHRQIHIRLNRNKPMWLAEQLAFVGVGEGGGIVARVLSVRYKPERFDSLSKGGYSAPLRSEPTSIRRLVMQVVPFLSALRRNCGGVVAIDGFGNGIHPLTSIALLSKFMQLYRYPSCPQLIACTQDALLMRPDLLRHDEIWLCERNFDGSRLYSLREFKDFVAETNLSRHYLKGSMGAVPQSKFRTKSANWKQFSGLGS